MLKSKTRRLLWERHLMTKRDRMEKLHQKIAKKGEIETAEDYLKIANSVFGEERHKARQRIIKKLRSIN